jgi:hypothetical protein
VRSDPPPSSADGPLRAYEAALAAATRGDDLALERLRRSARGNRRSTDNINRAVVDATRARLLDE